MPTRQAANMMAIPQQPVRLLAAWLGNQARPSHAHSADGLDLSRDGRVFDHGIIHSYITDILY